jgi:hypothetical protein
MTRFTGTVGRSTLQRLVWIISAYCEVERWINYVWCEIKYFGASVCVKTQVFLRIKCRVTQVGLRESVERVHPFQMRSSSVLLSLDRVPPAMTSLALLLNELLGQNRSMSHCYMATTSLRDVAVLLCTPFNRHGILRLYIFVVTIHRLVNFSFKCAFTFSSP